MTCIMTGNVLIPPLRRATTRFGQSHPTCVPPAITSPPLPLFLHFLPNLPAGFLTVIYVSADRKAVNGRNRNPSIPVLYVPA
jgi:hypothetical protein